MRNTTGSYRTYLSLVNLQPWSLEFAVKDLPLGRISALVPEFAMKDLSLGGTLMMMMMTINSSWEKCTHIGEIGPIGAP